MVWHCVDLNVDASKILGTHFSYNEKLKEQNFYKIATDMQQVLKIRKMTGLTLEGKIVFQTIITTVAKHIFNKLQKIQNAFFLE